MIMQLKCDPSAALSCLGKRLKAAAFLLTFAMSYELGVSVSAATPAPQAVQPGDHQITLDFTFALAAPSSVDALHLKFHNAIATSVAVSSKPLREANLDATAVSVATASNVSVINRFEATSSSSSSLYTTGYNLVGTQIPFAVTVPAIANKSSIRLGASSVAITAIVNALSPKAKVTFEYTPGSGAVGFNANSKSMPALLGSVAVGQTLVVKDFPVAVFVNQPSANAAPPPNVELLLLITPVAVS